MVSSYRRPCPVVPLVVVVVVVALLACFSPVAAVEKEATDLEPRVDLLVTDPTVIDAANFAVKELQELSDSGVYRSLSLGHVASAQSQEGVYHHNVFLTLHLLSPHFKGGAPESVHEVIVMTSKDDGVRSFAIDEFPVMDEDAIEQYWIQKVEEHRAMRERVFDSLEKEFAKAQ